MLILAFTKGICQRVLRRQFSVRKRNNQLPPSHFLICSFLLIFFPRVLHPPLPGFVICVYHPIMLFPPSPGMSASSCHVPGPHPSPRSSPAAHVPWSSAALCSAHRHPWSWGVIYSPGLALPSPSLKQPNQNATSHLPSPFRRLLKNRPFVTFSAGMKIKGPQILQICAQNSHGTKQLFASWWKNILVPI